MRIISGNLRGKKILSPLDKSTRPLKDMVRESIFNIIEHSKKESVAIKNANVLDLFSGTGSFGIECLSRGAKQVIFFENYKESIKILKKNIELLRLNEKIKIIEEDAYNLGKTNLGLKKFDLIFLDPPFKDSKINILIELISYSKIISKKTLIIIHRNKKIEEKISNKLTILRERIYGLSKIIFGKIS
jgi:16S rRNA (guanine966-N2)-methyltransferase|tara:strand:- start:270 stop:833 length:564 start_codon:yes stop_codon:yes gene_type:complete